tara:strand:- start:248 stop:496 length:249 start_codon:yes stop_codon:yes gene_type:complete
MKKTIKLIDEQHAALVQVIQWLDSNGHSNEPIRETVDKVLNGTTWNTLERDSNKEIKQAEAAFEISREIGFDDDLSKPWRSA